jgi:hypothetical protein
MSRLFSVLFFLAISCLGTISSPIYAQWIQSVSLSVEQVNCIAAKDSFLFAGTDSGLFRSSDKGFTWTAIAQDFFCTDPEYPPVYPVPVNSLITKDTLFFAGWQGGIARSSDDGATWTSSSNAPWRAGGYYVNGPVLLSNLGNYLFAATNTAAPNFGFSAAVWRSSDNGATWTGAYGGLGFPYISSLVAGQNLYVGSSNDFPTAPVGVYISGDSGASWHSFNNGLSNTRVHALTLSDSFLFAGTDSGVFLSYPTVATWIPENAGLTDTVLTLQYHDPFLFAGTEHRSICVSSNNGATWTSFNTGLPIGWIQSLSVIGGNLYLAINDNGLWRRPLTDFYPTIALSVSSSWNLISIPAEINPTSATSFLPAATTNAFTYSPGIGYRIQDTLTTGYGYWVKFDSSQTQQFKALPIHTDTVNVVRGWNLIGSISDTINQNSITTLNYQLTLSNFYSYSGSYSIDTLIVPGKGYWVKANENGRIVLSSVPSTGNRARTRVRIVPTSELPPPAPNASESKQTQLPKEYSLSQNYPNPFNPTTVINYALPRDGDVTMRIYNVLGQVVSTLVDEYESAGYKSVKFDATDIPSGIYFCRFSSGNFADVKKLVVMK